MKYWLSVMFTLLVVVGLLAFLALRVPPLLQVTKLQTKIQNQDIETTLVPLAKLAFTTTTKRETRALQELNKVAVDIVSNGYINAMAVVGTDQYMIAASNQDWLKDNKTRYMLNVCSFPDIQPISIEKIEILNDSEKTVGYLCLGYNNLFVATSPDMRMIEIVAAIGAAMFLLFFSLQFMARQNLVKDIEVLKDSVERIGKGDWQTRINIPGNTVVAQFGRALDTMAQELVLGTENLRSSEERFQLAIKGSNDVIWDWDIQTDRLYLSPRFASLLLYSEREIPGLFGAWLKLLHPEDIEPTREALEAHFKRNEPFVKEVRIRSKDGRWSWFLARGQAVFDKQSQAKRMVGSFSDITKRKETEAAFGLQKDRLETILASIIDGVVTTNIEGIVDYLNPQAEKILGWQLHRAQGMPLSDVAHLKRAGTEVAEYFNVMTVLDETLKREEMIVLPDAFELTGQGGRLFYITFEMSPLREHGGEMIGSIMILHDKTEIFLSGEELKDTRGRAQATLQSIADGVITTDLRGFVESINPSAESVTGWTQTDAKNKPLLDVFAVYDEKNPRKPVITESLLKNVLSDGYTLQLNDTFLTNREDSAKKYYISLSISPILNDEEQIIGSVISFQNVTEQRNLNLKLEYERTHDKITGLLNRFAFERKLETLIDEAKRGKRNVLCYLDLDQFKLVNDTSGHEAGDEMLKQLAKILTANLPSDITLARLGGDEFGLLLENYNIEASVNLAKGLRDEINHFHFEWKGNSFNVGVSTGVVPLTQHIETSQDALRAADQACYMAKSKGRNYIQLYEQSEETSAWRGQMEWVHRLSRAIKENKNLILFAQPIIPLKPEDMSHKHYELLIRMTDEQGKFVSPGLFLPGAERYGLISDLDRWVVENALRQMMMSLKRSPNLQDTVFSINLSGASMTSEEFLSFVKQMIKGYKVPTKMLCFEITESVAVANLEQARNFVNQLQKLGCSFSLDDFGSGYASFSYLKNLPVNYLKIDGSFIKDILSDEYDSAMVTAINYVAHKIGLETIAEYVENEQIVQKLKQLGINYGQGYHFGKPQPMIEVIAKHYM